MAISKTKYEASKEEIKELFFFHKMGNVLDVAALGNGEFNAAYKVTCDNGTVYALKIAPPEDSAVLRYEKNMMEAEVYWYSQMHEKTDILCPRVFISGRKSLVGGRPVRSRISGSSETEDLHAHENTQDRQRPVRLYPDGAREFLV